MYLGDYSAGETVYFRFSTQRADGTPITLADSPTIEVYKDDAAVPMTLDVGSVVLDVDPDHTGSHSVALALTDTDFTTQSDYAVALGAGTVDGISVVGRVIAHFSIENRSLNDELGDLGISGVNPTIVTVEEADHTPIPSAHVWMTITDNENHAGTEIIGGSWETTDDQGKITIWTDLAVGTAVHLWAQCPGYGFNYANDAVVGTAATVTGEVVTTTGLDKTLDDLIDLLRIRLNDVDEGNYQSAHLMGAINLAYRETVVLSKCHRKANTIVLVEGTHTYDAAEVFAPIEIPGLDKVQLGDVGVSIAAWDAASNGTPEKWMPLTGSYFRLYPTPAATPGSITVYGYARPAVLTSGTDVPSALPDAFAISAVLDRAEAECRKWRAQVPGNAAMVVMLMDQWRGWCLKTAEAVGG